jgi:hypothetical protein
VVLSHVVTGAVAVATGENLLANSSFEADSNGDGLADSWVRSSGGTVGTLTAERNAPARHGDVAQRIIASALGAAAFHHVYQDVYLPEDLGGEPFTLLTDSRVATGTTLRLEMSFYDASSTLLETKGKDFPSTDGNVWRRSRVVFIAPATTERIRVRLMQKNGSGATAAARFDRAGLYLGDVDAQWSPKADELLPKAVTEVYTQSSISGGVTYGTTSTVRPVVDKIVYTPPIDCTVIVSAIFDMQATVGAFEVTMGAAVCAIPAANISTSFYPGGGYTPGGTNQVADFQSCSAARAGYVSQHAFEVSGGTSYWFGLTHVDQYPTPPAHSITYWNLRLRIEVIKK